MDDVQQDNANECERPVLADFSEYRFHVSPLYRKKSVDSS